MTRGRSLKTARTTLKILDLLLAVPDGLTVSQAAQFIGKGAATTRYLLNSLREEGFAIRVGQRFLATPSLLRVDAQTVDKTQREPAKDMWQLLSELSQRTRHRAYLALADPQPEIASVVGHQGQPIMPGVGPRIGSQLHALAIGKVFLANLSDDSLNAYIDTEGLPSFTDGTISDGDRLRADLGLVRQRGYAVDVEECVEGFCCVAAPLFDDCGQLSGAVGVSSSARTFAATRPDLVSTVLTVAGPSPSSPWTLIPGPARREWRSGPDPTAREVRKEQGGSAVKAARLFAYDKPFSEAVKLVDVPEPKITGPFDVIVKIAGAGVCRTDIHLVQGVWQQALGDPNLPYTIGHENAGYVEEVGSAVTEVAKGDPVILHPLITCGLCYACRTAYDMACEKGVFPGLDGSEGGWAEYLKTSIRCVIKLAPGTDPVPLAPFADAGITAYHAVKKALPFIHPGVNVVVVGVGGLGHFAVQLLKVMSTGTVIALDSNRDRLQFAEDLGADHSALAGEDGGVGEILKLTEGRGADVILDFVAENDTPKYALRYLRPARGGTYIVIGYGGVVAPTTLDMIANEINVIGSIVGSYSELTELMELNRQKRVQITSTTFPLTEYAHALEELDQGHVRGRGVLVP